MATYLKFSSSKENYKKNNLRILLYLLQPPCRRHFDIKLVFKSIEYT